MSSIVHILKIKGFEDASKLGKFIKIGKIKALDIGSLWGKRENGIERQGSFFNEEEGFASFVLLTEDKPLNNEINRLSQENSSFIFQLFSIAPGGEGQADFYEYVNGKENSTQSINGDPVVMLGSLLAGKFEYK